MRKGVHKSYANGLTLVLFLALNLFSLFSLKILGNLGGSKYYLVSLINIAVFLVPILVILIRSRQKAKTALKMRFTKPKWIPVTVFASLSVTLLGIFLNTIFIKAFNLSATSLPTNPLGSVSWEEPFSAILAVIIVPAIMEELFFRGAYLFSFGEEKVFSAMFSGALCFAFLHSTPNNFFGPFLAGIVYAMLTIIFGSVYPAIFAHILNNIFSALISYYSTNIKEGGLETPILITGIVLLLIFIYLTLKLIEPFLHKIKRKPVLSLSERVKKQKNTVNVYTVSFYILLLLWLSKMIAIFAGAWG